MTRFLLIVWATLNLPALYAQQPLADSLERRLRSTLPDSTRALDMVYLAMYTEPLDMNKAHDRYREAVDFSLSKQLWYHAALALRFQSTPFHNQGDRTRERENLLRAIDLFLRSDHPKALRQLASTYGNLGDYYRSKELFDSAIDYRLKAIQIQEANQYDQDLLISYVNIGMYYQQLKLHHKQLEYLQRSLEVARKINTPKAHFLANLQAIHYYTETGNYPVAKQYVDSARVHFSDAYDFTMLQSYFLLSAATYHNLQRYDTAVHYYQKAYEQAVTYQSPWNMIDPLLQMGDIHTRQKQYAAAEAVLKQAITLARKDSANTFLKDGYGYLSKLYEASGRPAEALDAYKQHITFRDTLLSEDRRNYILNLEQQYESEKKDAYIRLQQADLKQRNLVNSILAGSVIALFVLSFLLYRNYQQKQKLQQQRIGELETEKKLMAAEALLEGEEQDRTRLARDLHDGLGGMLSGIKFSLNSLRANLSLAPEQSQAFERSIDMLDSSIMEMRRVAHNMMPDALVRYGLNTALEDYVSELNRSGMMRIVHQTSGPEKRNLEQTTVFGIYRIAQELINNAIKHAGATELLVQTYWEPSQLTLTVEDNGRGFDPAMPEAAGMGWKNIRSRVHFLKGRLDIDSTPGVGSSIQIEIPV